tara:strand:- start:34 stop:522 length:489 start_codon:yes stop_codon:yes gene_type:complete
MIEEFRDVVGYEGIYKVSNLGRVKSLAHKRRFSERMLKPGEASNGYFIVVLRKKGKSNTKAVHQLVAEAFLGHTPCGYKLIVNHEDHDKLNNKLDNLEIITQRKNTDKKHIKSSSEYVGVSWDKVNNKWLSSIYINGKLKNLGRFACELKAAYTYQKALNAL